MNRLFLFFIISSITLSQPITWTEITSNYPLPLGIKIFRGDRTLPVLKIFYLDVDMNNPDLVIHPYISTNKTVNNFVPSVGAYAGINGGFFGATGSLSAVVYPDEVKAQNVASVTRFNQSYPVIRSLFGMNYDRSFHVNWIYHFGSNVSDIYKFDAPLSYTNNQTNPLSPPEQSAGTAYENLLIGIGGAPTLVKNSNINITYDEEIMWGSGVGYDNRDPRTAVGYTSNNHVIMLTADGRQTSSEGVSLPELAQIMIDLGCAEAMNLDGGGSSQMAVGNQFVNSPSELRAVPTILTVTNKDSLKLPQTPVYEKIIDTGDSGANLFGTGWFTSANPGFWGSTPAQLHTLGNGEAYAEFILNLSAEAQYDVYGWWVASSNRSQDTPFIITHKNSTDTVRVNQVQNGSVWKLIGSYQFSADTTQKIVISNAGTTGAFVVADAIRIISFNPTTSIYETNEITNDFVLYQNYPNPFNPSTNIRWQSPVDGWQTLKIYNILGSEIATLVNDFRIAGNHEINFNSSDLANGIYFYKITGEYYSQTKKMCLVK